MQFTLPLSEATGQQRHITTLHLMLAFLLCFIGVSCGVLYWFTATSPAFKTTGGAYRPFLYFGGACLLGGAAILALTVFQKQWIREERNSRLFRFVELLLMAGGSVLFLLRGWKIPAGLFGLMSAVIVFAIVREQRYAGNGTILIDDAGIQLPVAAGRRSLRWTEIDGVLLRFGTLTVECTENRLVQRNVGALSFTPDALEAFCLDRIGAHREERTKNNW